MDGTISNNRLSGPLTPDYIYLGDKQTAQRYKNKPCNAIRRPDGKCIRSRMGTMLVVFYTGPCVVMARRLRKLR